ncbi:MAG: hypothetical protein NTX49_10625 [Chlamydiae bacterium]|nr:hypothetical protein [Chlamydiota bacterium]
MSGFIPSDNLFVDFKKVQDFMDAYVEDLSMTKMEDLDGNLQVIRSMEERVKSAAKDPLYQFDPKDYVSVLEKFESAIVDRQLEILDAEGVFSGEGIDPGPASRAAGSILRPSPRANPVQPPLAKRAPQPPHMSITTIFQGIREMEKLGNVAAARQWFSFLPPPFQKTYIDMLSDVASSRMGRAVTIDEITQEDKTKVTLVLANFESRVGIVYAVMQPKFTSIEKTPKITPLDVAKAKEKLVHELASMLYVTTDVTGRPFIESTAKDLKGIIQDYYARYPAIGLSGLMPYFYPDAWKQ